MPSDVMVWDLETVPDIAGFARANNLVGKSPEEIRTAIGDDFPKLIYHSIICIGALVATRTSNGWEVQAVGAPHVGQRPEKELIESFVNVDLCDVLSSFSYGAKVKLDELSRIMGLPGKPDGIDGSQVEIYFNAGRIQEIADYCKSDVINTYRLWLRPELFCGRLDQKQFEYSEVDILAS
jgi:predicted PolB exonuclease-like 3'-5' exonuclease